MTWKGSADAYDGKLTGLSKLHRSGDCTLAYDSKALTVSAVISIPDLRAYYAARVRFMAISLGASAKASVRTVTVKLVVRQQLVPGGRLALQTLTIQQLSGIDFTISGLGPLVWVLSKLTSAFSNLLHHVIARAIEKPIKAKLSEVIAKYKIPV